MFDEITAPIIIGYIDPATGYVIFSALAALVSGIAGVLSVAAAATFAFFKRSRKIIATIAISVLAIWGSYEAWHWHRLNPEPIGKRIVVLGIDGLDAKITKTLMDQGKLPAMAKLADTGSFRPLRTSNPAQSPVAWSSFLTGHHPDSHGIFDFIERRPEDYSLGLVFERLASTPDPRFPVKTWTDYLTEQKVNQLHIGLPLAWPAPEVSGRVLGGMGVPDIGGTQGTFTLVTTDLDQKAVQSGRIVKVPGKDTFEFALSGPTIVDDDTPYQVSVSFTVKQRADDIILGVKDTNTSFQLEPGQTSDWIELEFDLGWWQVSNGYVKARLLSLEPELRLYFSPVQVALDGETGLTYPKRWAKDLYEAYGPVHTAGMPFDTWALSENILTDDEFLAQAKDLTDERRDLVNRELDKFADGVFFAYFEQVDIIQHMFWRYRDSLHPLHISAPVAASRAIEAAYIEADQIVADVQEQLRDDDQLIILSDHGFANYRHSADINHWLVDMGYMVKFDERRGIEALYNNVDWRQTYAYGAGFNGIYLNLRGREQEGIVDLDEAEGLLDELAERMLALTNPTTGQPLLARLDLRTPTAEDQDGPDIILGFTDGHRGAWETALGGTSGKLVRPNAKKWSGDHMVDPKLVPGVLFTNYPIEAEDPGLEDIAPSLLELVGFDAETISTAGFDGQPISKRNTDQ